jgi:hypothetical protein
LNKQRRSQGVPEIDEPEMMEEMGKKYLEKTLIRDTVKVSFLRGAGVAGETLGWIPRLRLLGSSREWSLSSGVGQFYVMKYKCPECLRAFVCRSDTCLGFALWFE